MNHANYMVLFNNDDNNDNDIEYVFGNEKIWK